MTRIVHTLSGSPDETRKTDCGRWYDDPAIQGDYIVARSMSRSVTCETCKAVIHAEGMPCAES